MTFLGTVTPEHCEVGSTIPEENALPFFHHLEPHVADAVTVWEGRGSDPTYMPDWGGPYSVLVLATAHLPGYSVNILGGDLGSHSSIVG